MEEVVVTRKYQITIPKKIREKFGIKIGDRMLVNIEGDKIVLKPIREETALERLSGIADKYLGGPKSLDAVKLVEESIETEASLH